MLPIIIESLILASSGILSFGSMTIVVLLLISEKGKNNGFGYAFGYILAYTLIGFSIVFFSYQTSDNNTREPSLIVPIVLMILGSLLIWLGIRNKNKPVSEEKKENRFLSMIDRFTPVKAFGFGALVSIINFKNLALFLTSLSVVILSDLQLGEKLIITLLVVLVFCLSVLIPIGIFILFPTRGNSLLKGIRQFIDNNSRKISIWAPAVFGLVFIIKGLSDIL